MQEIHSGSSNNSFNLKQDRLSLFALGGQKELGQILWVASYGGKLLLLDAGAAYPLRSLPGVDLLLPNMNFLTQHQDRILALVLTNGHEEHSGATKQLLKHVKIPKILAPGFVANLLSGQIQDSGIAIDTIEPRQKYELGPFSVEWIRVNNAIADAYALSLDTPEGRIVYTSSFKLDQTPVDGKSFDLARLAALGDQGVKILIGASAGVETMGYSPSERQLTKPLHTVISSASSRVVTIIPGFNTHRLQLLFDLAKSCGRKVVLYGETLIQAAVAAVVTGNLNYDRKLEAGLKDLANLDGHKVLIVATGVEGNPLNLLNDLAYGRLEDLALCENDTVVYSASLPQGSLRVMANILDQLMSNNISVYWGEKDKVHVQQDACQEELKLMLNLTKPEYFVPAMGEGRHIAHHAQLAINWGLSPFSIYKLDNGQVLEVKGQSLDFGEEIEAQPVLFDRAQGERVTTYSVQERRSLSQEGILTVVLAVDSNLNLLTEPQVESHASAFINSTSWQEVQGEVINQVKAIVSGRSEKMDAQQLRAQIREAVNKMIRSKLRSRPLIHIVVQEYVTSRLEQEERFAQ